MPAMNACDAQHLGEGRRVCSDGQAWPHTPPGHATSRHACRCLCIDVHTLSACMRTDPRGRPQVRTCGMLTPTLSMRIQERAIAIMHKLDQPKRRRILLACLS
eukprot:365052-Chlamydomonas_euryale.AAC.8